MVWYAMRFVFLSLVLLFLCPGIYSRGGGCGRGIEVSLPALLINILPQAIVAFNSILSFSALVNGTPNSNNFIITSRNSLKNT